MLVAFLFASCKKGDEVDQAATVAELAGEYSGRYALTISIKVKTRLGEFSPPPPLPSTLSTPSGTTKEAFVTATVDPNNNNRLNTVASLRDVDFMSVIDESYADDTYTFTNNLENFTKRDGNITGYSVQNTEERPLITSEKILLGVGDNRQPLELVLSNDLSVGEVDGLNATFSGGLEVPRARAAMLFPVIEANSEISSISIDFNIVLSDMSKQ